jgi:hypothetical protein
MRTAIVLGLLMCVSTARAGELDGLGDKIVGCLVIPVDIGDAPFKATFEVTIDKAGKAETVAVVAYDPQSEVMAKAAPLLAKGSKRCWPAGIKTSPVRLTFAWNE